MKTAKLELPNRTYITVNSETDLNEEFLATLLAEKLTGAPPKVKPWNGVDELVRVDTYTLVEHPLSMPVVNFEKGKDKAAPPAPVTENGGEEALSIPTTI